MVKNTEWLVVFAKPDYKQPPILDTIKVSDPFMFIQYVDRAGALRHWLQVGSKEQFGYIAVHHTTQFQEVTDA